MQHITVAVASCQKNDKKYARTPLGDNIDKASARILHVSIIVIFISKLADRVVHKSNLQTSNILCML